MQRIITNYLRVGFLIQFFQAFLLFSFIFYLDKLIVIGDFLVKEKASFKYAMMFLFFSFAPIFAVAFPIGILMGALSYFGSLKSRGEFVGFSQIGISLKDLLKSNMVFACILSMFYFFLNEIILPWSNQRLSVLEFELKKSPLVLIKEKEFFKSPDFEIFITHIKKEKLEKIYINRLDSGLSIFAKSGKILKKDNYLIFNLEDGYLFSLEGGAKLLHFKSYKFSYLINSKDNIPLTPLHLNIIQNLKTISDRKKLNLLTYPFYFEIFKRINFTLSCICFFILALLLSIFLPKTTKTLAFGFAAITIIFYYISFCFAQSFVLSHFPLSITLLFLPPTSFFLLSLLIYIKVKNNY